MVVHEPIPHWNNFAVSELKAILEHCNALDSLGIAQDNEMMADIERDIEMREKTQTQTSPPSKRNFENRKQEKENQNPQKNQSQEYLLA
jgi:hypothetical protein